MNQALIDLGDYVVTAVPDLASAPMVANDELTIHSNPASILRLLAFLRDDTECQFKQLVDLCAVDWPGRAQRFDVVYHLLSHRQNQRLRVKAQTDEDTPVPSACEVFSSAAWYEREAWDLYGVFFADHPDLRRLLSDYGFEGHPLRTDFPLTG